MAPELEFGPCVTCGDPVDLRHGCDHGALQCAHHGEVLGCCTAPTYDCGECGRDTHLDLDPSPCEDHGVGPCCAPCGDCRLDAAEEYGITERREAS